MKNIHHIIFQTSTYVSLTSRVVTITYIEREIELNHLVSSNPCRTYCIVEVKEGPGDRTLTLETGLTTQDLSSCQLKSSTGDKA